jgi:hypothetical protein
MLDQNLIIGLIVLAVVVFAVYTYAPKFRAMLSGLGLEGFQDAKNGAAKNGNVIINPKKTTAGQSMGGNGMSATGPAAKAAPAAMPAPKVAGKEGFADYASVDGDGSLGAVPMAAAAKPAGCYARQTLSPAELLPADPNGVWAAANPQGSGDIQGKNFLSAGALIGVNTIGSSLRNGNLQIRAEPPNPQAYCGPWLQSTIEPDLSRRPLE